MDDKQYTLRSSEIVINYLTDPHFFLVIDRGTPANCGTISESFTELNHSDMSPFSYDTSTKVFKILYNENESKARIYQI